MRDWGNKGFIRVMKMLNSGTNILITRKPMYTMTCLFPQALSTVSVRWALTGYMSCMFSLLGPVRSNLVGAWLGLALGLEPRLKLGLLVMSLMRSLELNLAFPLGSEVAGSTWRSAAGPSPPGA